MHQEYRAGSRGIERRYVPGYLSYPTVLTFTLKNPDTDSQRETERGHSLIMFSPGFGKSRNPRAPNHLPLRPGQAL